MTDWRKILSGEIKIEAMATIAEISNGSIVSRNGSVAIVIRNGKEEQENVPHVHIVKSGTEYQYFINGVWKFRGQSRDNPKPREISKKDIKCIENFVEERIDKFKTIWPDLQYDTLSIDCDDIVKYFKDPDGQGMTYTPNSKPGQPYKATSGFEDEGSSSVSSYGIDEIEIIPGTHMLEIAFKDQQVAVIDLARANIFKNSERDLNSKLLEKARVECWGLFIAFPYHDVYFQELRKAAGFDYDFPDNDDEIRRSLERVRYARIDDAESQVASHNPRH